MRTPAHLFTAIFALLALIATGIAWQQYNRVVRLEAAALDHPDTSALRRQLVDAEQRYRDLAAVRDPVTGTEDAAGTAVNRSARDPNQFGGRGGRGTDFRAVMDRPEIQRAQTLLQKSALDTRYAGLFKSLNLSAAQTDKLKNVLLERDSTMRDVMMAAREQGIDPRTNPEAFRKLLSTTQAESDAAIKAVIGEDGFAQYTQYQATAAQRTVVNQLQQSLSYTRDPLTDTQAAQLVQILAATSPQSAAPMAPPMGEPPGGGRGGGMGGGMGIGGGIATGAPITPEAVAQAQLVLTATQIQALQDLQQLQQAQLEAQRVMRESGVDVGPGGRGGRGGG